MEASTFAENSIYGVTALTRDRSSVTNGNVNDGWPRLFFAMSKDLTISESKLQYAEMSMSKPSNQTQIQDACSIKLKRGNIPNDQTNNGCRHHRASDLT